jgi:hypothetical protein
MMRFSLVIPLLGALALGCASPAAAQADRTKACNAPPVTVDFDMRDIPEPLERRQSYYGDFMYSTFALQAKEALDIPRSARKVSGKPKPAYNVNCLNEVPDSSWFTNRNTKAPMSLAAVQHGPNTGTGPAPGIWHVIQGKSQGISPGFLIRDSRGDVYQLKFDPPQYPEMATAAEVIASKLYFAAGYNVKENYIVIFDRQQLQVNESAKISDRYGRPRQMTEEDLDGILSRVARREDGAYRAVAGKFLDGVAKGPFTFEGVRKDDPNDWIPHEHRRDLRGLRVFASWVNDNDFREGNTLDMYVEEGGRRFLKHYFIDIGSTLGSETIFPNTDRVGNEYILDGAQVIKSLFSFGLYRPRWKGSSKNVTYPSAGFLESEIFDPGRWRPNYPVLPFENMTLQDAFWGARLVLSFTDEQIRAAVGTGEFSDPGAAKLLANVLIERRDKIARHWLARVNPLDRFAITTTPDGTPQLSFQDLEVERGVLPAPRRSYEYTIQDAQTGRTVQGQQSASSPSLDVSSIVSRGGSGQQVYRITVRSLRQGHRQSSEIDVYVAGPGGSNGLKVVGVDRKG